MALGDDYLAAVRSGNKPYANYLAQMLAAQAGININANTVEAAPLSVLQPGIGALPALPPLPGQATGGGLPDLSTAADAILQGIMHPWDTITGANAGTKPPPIVSSTTAALNFITDIGRVTTTVLGLILIIAGIFALARGPAVQIVGGALREAATS